MFTFLAERRSPSCYLGFASGSH